MRFDAGFPSPFFLIIRNSDKPRRSFCPGLSPVEHILRVRSKAKIIPSIIESIAVSMVNQKTGRRTHNLSVHRKNLNPAISVISEPNSINASVVFLGAPVKIAQPVVILRVNYRPFPFAQINPAVSVTISPPPIRRHRPHANPVQPDWNPE
jgi:hypothetical protein